MARGAGPSSPQARGRPSARARPRPRRARRPARVAVVVRQPRPPEHPGRPRPRPGRSQGLRLALDDGRPEPGLRVVRARPRAGRPGDPGPAPRATSSIAADLTELRVLHAADPASRSPTAAGSTELRRPDPRAELVRRRRWPGRRARGRSTSSRPGWPPPTRCLVAHVAVDGLDRRDRRDRRVRPTPSDCRAATPVGELPRRGSRPTSTWPPPQLAGPVRGRDPGLAGRAAPGRLGPPRRAGAAAGRRPPSGADAVRASWPGRRGRCCPGSPDARSPSRRRRPAGWSWRRLAPAPSAAVGLVAGPRVDRGGGGGHAGVGRVARATGCSRGDDAVAAAGRGPGRARSTSCTSPATAATPATTRSSPPSSWPTGRGSATTSTSCRTPPPTVVLSACELGRVVGPLRRGGRSA